MKLSGGLTDTRLIIQASVLGSPEEEEEEEGRERGMEDSDWRRGNVGAEREGWIWVVGGVGMDKQTTGNEGCGDG